MGLLEDCHHRPVQRLDTALMLFKNVLSTMRTVSHSLEHWVLPSCVSDLQILRPLNRSLSFISNQSLLTLVLGRHIQLGLKEILLGTISE